MRLLKRSSRRYSRNGATSWKTCVWEEAADALRRDALVERKRKPLFLVGVRDWNLKVETRYLRAVGAVFNQPRDSMALRGLFTSWKAERRHCGEGTEVPRSTARALHVKSQRDGGLYDDCPSLQQMSRRRVKRQPSSSTDEKGKVDSRLR